MRIEKGVFYFGYACRISKSARIKTVLAANNNLGDRESALCNSGVQVPDPFNSFRLRSFGAGDTVAGPCDRIGGDRGVTKTPPRAGSSTNNLSQKTRMRNMLLKGNLLFNAERMVIVVIVEFFCLLFAVGCGDGNTAPIINSLVVSPDALALSMGVTGQLKAIGTFSNGKQRDLSSIVIWEVSEPKLAVITSAGLVTPRAVGKTTIRATYGSVLVSVNVIISTATLRSLLITPAATTLPLGKQAS